MSDFVFLYRGGDRAPSPEQAQQQMQQWTAWMKQLREQGVLADTGQPLEPGGKVVRGKEKAITDGPYAETKDLIGGFSMVRAQDLAHAAELSKGCPIFESNGMVEVRPVMKMDM